MPFKIAVLISGSGTTLHNLLAQSNDGRLRASVCGVIASRECGGLAHAMEAKVPCTVIPRTPSRNVAFNVNEFSNRVSAQLVQWNPDLVVLAGFLSPYIPAPRYVGKVLNIHPALLPQFGGKGMYGNLVHRAVLDSGAKVSGCTVHVVDEHYDHGQILAQRVVPVLDEDTTMTLSARVREAEKNLYPEVINWFADGRITWDDQGRLVLKDRRILLNGVSSGPSPGLG
jgi:formyltetrahydrofolate-dependent phosphoribosylglycinamide formyltransferase